MWLSFTINALATTAIHALKNPETDWVRTCHVCGRFRRLTFCSNLACRVFRFAQICGSHAHIYMHYRCIIHYRCVRTFAQTIVSVWTGIYLWRCSSVRNVVKLNKPITYVLKIYKNQTINIKFTNRIVKTNAMDCTDNTEYTTLHVHRTGPSTPN